MLVFLFSCDAPDFGSSSDKNKTCKNDWKFLQVYSPAFVASLSSVFDLVSIKA